MVKIFLRSAQKDLGSGTEECLIMRDTNGEEGVNDLMTVGERGSKVIWELERESGIKKIVRIWGKEQNSKVFKKEPGKPLLKTWFEVELLEPDSQQEERYNIKYLTIKGKEVTIDPFIRIPPPR